MFGKSTRTTRVVATVALLMGAAWVWATLVDPLLSPIAPADGEAARPFLIMLLLVLAVPGFICVYYGIRLLREVRISSIKGAVGSTHAALVIFLASKIVGMVSSTGSEIYFAVTLLAFSGLALPSYVGLCQIILRREGFVVPPARSMFGRLLVLFLSLEVWWLAAVLFAEYAPRQPQNPDLQVQPWPIVGLVVPIVVGIAFYKTANAMLGNSRREKPGITGHVPDQPN